MTTTQYACTPEQIAATLASMIAPHLKNPTSSAFFVWERSDRAIVVFNEDNLKDLTSPHQQKFIHALSTRLGGVRIVKTNSIGVYLQVGYSPMLKLDRLASQPLDLSSQRHPYDVPIGMTTGGALWLSILDLGNALIGGSTGFGKTNLAHTWIRALIHGQASDLWLYDGKSGNHFDRYEGQPGVKLADPLDQALTDLSSELARRRDLFKREQVHDITAYNKTALTTLRPIALFVDEAALIDPQSAEQLTSLARTGREMGLSLVVLAQRTAADDVAPGLKNCLTTRICFPVPQRQDSDVVLGYTGAELLPKVKGRLLITHAARLVEAQAFYVDLASDHHAPGLPVGQDWQICLRAATDEQGRLSIPILEGWNWSPYRARTLLKRFEASGWLTVAGQGETRTLTPWVLEAVSQSLKVTSKSQS